MAPKRQPKIDDLPPAANQEEEEASSDYESEEQDSTDEDQQPQQSEKPKSDSDPDDEGEEEESDESEEEEEEEEEEENPVEKTPSAQTHQSPLKSESTEGSDSESDSDTDSKAPNSPTASAFTVKPIATKPIPESPEPKKVAPKSNQVKASAVSKSKNGKVSNGDEKKSTKRPAETEQVGKNLRGKKSKIANGDANGDSVEEKKPVINRGWSENGEIALLQGMIDYKSKKGGDPLLNLSAFHEFIKDLVSDDVTKTKLSDKMRRLKKKYQNNAEKGKNGEDPVFSKPFECKSFELSKKLWGGEGSTVEVSDTKVKSSRNKKNKKEDNIASKSVSKSVGNKEIVMQEEEEVKDEIEEDVDVEEKTDLLSLFPLLSSAIELDAPTYLSGSKDYIKGIISSMGKEKATELEEGWKNFRVMEYELRAKRAEMMLKQTQEILDVMKPSKS